MTEVILTFETPEQADNAVLALSNGYKVEQWYQEENTSIKPYHVKVCVPNNDIVMDF